jgi:hypothetical protein
VDSANRAVAEPAETGVAGTDYRRRAVGNLELAEHARNVIAHGFRAQ